eukprot:2775030-Amphidinium_carterae.1
MCRALDWHSTPDCLRRAQNTKTFNEHQNDGRSELQTTPNAAQRSTAQMQEHPTSPSPGLQTLELLRPRTNPSAFVWCGAS